MIWLEFIIEFAWQKLNESSINSKVNLHKRIGDKIDINCNVLTYCCLVHFLWNNQSWWRDKRKVTSTEMLHGVYVFYTGLIFGGIGHRRSDIFLNQKPLLYCGNSNLATGKKRLRIKLSPMSATEKNNQSKRIIEN